MKENIIIAWNKQKLILICLVLAFGMFGCLPQQENLDLKPHVNKLVLRVNELSNQVYNLDNRLKRLENREVQIPDHVRRLADLEVKVNRLQEETQSYFTAGQEGMSLLSKFDQKIQDLRQELEDEKRKFVQFQEETGKKFEGLSPPSPVGLIPPAVATQKESLPSEKVGTAVFPAPDNQLSPPSSVPVVDEKSFYQEAYQTFLQKDWPAARRKFQAFLNSYPKSSLADNAQFWIGETFYNQKEYERAILEYEKVIQNYANEDKLPSALLKQAFAFYAIGRIKEAKILLKQLIEKFPESEQAQTAKKKLESMLKKEDHAH